jgi:hypothetical protein
VSETNFEHVIGKARREELDRSPVVARRFERHHPGKEMPQ